jgi:hypothetical protein
VAIVEAMLPSLSPGAIPHLILVVV